MPDGTVKCIENEIPFEVPEGWVWTRLKNLFLFQGGYAYKSKDYVPYSDYQIIRIGNVKNDMLYLDTEPTYVPQTIAELTNKYIIQKNDILFTMTGTRNKRDYFLTCTVEKTLKKIYLNQRVGCLRPISVYFDSRCICLFLKHKSVLDNIFKMETGNVNQGNIGSTSTMNLLVPIPPLKEQAEILSAFTKSFDICVLLEKEKTELQTIITQAKSKILDLAIRGKLVSQDPTDEPASVLLERIRTEKESLIKQGKIKREKNESFIFRGDDKSYYEQSGAYQTNIDNLLTFSIPQSWVWCKLSSAWNLLSGRDLSPTEYNDFQNGIPYITGASNFESGNLLINRWTSNPKVISKAGDLLITCKGTVGEVLINDIGDIHIARQIMVFRNDRELFTPFFKYTILCFLENIRESAHGVIPGISREDLLNIYLPIPPIAEQRRIVVAIETAFEQLDTIMNSLA